MFSMDAVCSPVMPGRTLRSRDSGSSFQAPWWAPKVYKAEAFQKVCSETMQPTVLEWLPDGKDNKAVILSGDKTVFTKRTIVKTAAATFGAAMTTMYAAHDLSASIVPL